MGTNTSALSILNTLLILLVALLQFVLKNRPQTESIQELEARLAEAERRLDEFQRRLNL